jgi:hypothetical protein
MYWLGALQCNSSIALETGQFHCSRRGVRGRLEVLQRQKIDFYTPDGESSVYTWNAIPAQYVPGASPWSHVYGGVQNLWSMYELWVMLGVFAWIASGGMCLALVWAFGRVKRPCAHCGDKFLPERSTARYSSAKWRVAAQRAKP